MNRALGKLSLLFLLSSLSACQLSDSTTESTPASDGTTETSDVSTDSSNGSTSTSVVQDPLVTYQWALYNYGQSSFASQGGTPGEDLNGFSLLPLKIENYADGLTGEGVQIAVLDTGLEIAHADLASNVLANGSYNFGYPSNGAGEFDPTNVYDTLEDHGTSVSGVIAARGGNGIGIMGVAPQASLRGINLLSYGDLTEELVAHGLNPESYPHLDVSQVGVFNKSYGLNPGYVGEDLEYSLQVMAALKQASTTLRDGKGVLFVKSGGNEYERTASGIYRWCQEANHVGLSCYNVNQETENATPYQMVIGAYNAKGKRASYSNTGSALWLVAPGGEYGEAEPAIMTTDQSGCKKGSSQTYWPVIDTDFEAGALGSGNETCDYTAAFNGTSAATPMVTGAVALLLQANPELKWYEVKQILAQTARQLDPDLASASMSLNGQPFELEAGWVENAAGYHFSNEYGFGSVDILAAVRLAKNWSDSDRLADFKESGPVRLTTSQTVPDSDSVGARFEMVLNEEMTLQTVEIQLSIEALQPSLNRLDNKIDASDYWIALTSPSGTKSVLLTPLNAYLSGYAMPDLRLVSHAFLGESAKGTWILQVVDVDGETGNYIRHKGEGRVTAVQLKTYGY